MKDTYDEAMVRVFQDEGGYSNDPGDPGGPTRYGITIYDCRTYWKSDATALDVRNLPKSVAADIYRKHYANPINYGILPPGVDYTVFDYGINSGVSRALSVYHQVKTNNDVDTINAIYNEREAYLKRLAQQPERAKFRKGWLDRTRRGRQLALSLNAKYKKPAITATAATTGAVIVTGAAATAQYPHLALYIIIGTAVLAILVPAIIYTYKQTQLNKGK